MIIRAVQKFSAVDSPGLLCATVFTPGCNLRCPFCHNGTLVLDDEPDVREEVVFDFLANLTVPLARTWAQISWNLGTWYI